MFMDESILLGLWMTPYQAGRIEEEQANAPIPLNAHSYQGIVQSLPFLFSPIALLLSKSQASLDL